MNPLPSEILFVREEEPGDTVLSIASGIAVFLLMFGGACMALVLV